MDYIDYSGSDAGVTINLETSQASGGHADGDVIEGGIDGIIGSDFADVPMQILTIDPCISCTER